MYSIDRQLVILKPKQPFLDWLNNVDKKNLSLEDVRSDCTVFLIPVVDNLDDAEKYVKSIFPDLFDLELSEWNVDEELWPNHRTIELFREWFDIYFHSTVIDTEEKEILKDELY
jgi:hypothetical protein